MLRLLFATFGLSTFVYPGEEPTQGVDIHLVSSVNSVAPSSTFTAGLKIHHHPGFHTYWKNPGVVGYPIRITWDLPDGFSAGEIRWPVPEMSSMAGYPVYGYEREVTLLVDLTAPATIPGKSVELKAEVAWMACSDACFPDNRTFSLTLPVTPEPEEAPALKPLFSAAEREIPQPLANWKASIETPRNAPEIRVILTPPPHLEHPGELSFYSSDAQISSDPAPEIVRLESGQYRISAERYKFSPDDAPSLPFILVAENVIGENGRKFGALDPAYPSR